MTVKAVLLDFDGVIVDSVNVKTEAFQTLFMDEPQHIPAIVDFHIANGGMSRFTKFEFIYRDILRRPLSQELSDEIGQRFSKLVMKKVIACPYMPGAFEFIKKYSGRIPLFIASATPQAELDEIVFRRGLSVYFQEVHGTPRGKAEVILDILSRYKLQREEFPFIGDAINDYQAAIQTGSPFYGYVNEGRGLFPDGVMVVHGFQELESLLF